MTTDNCSSEASDTIRTSHNFELEWTRDGMSPMLVTINGHEVDPIAPAFDGDCLSVPSLYEIEPPKFPHRLATEFTSEEIEEMRGGHFSEAVLTRIRDDLRRHHSSSFNTLPKID